jgi:NAD(P)-dependent dehydrogenase (short-subunit alcohol dehydrogenase family)
MNLSVPGLRVLVTAGAAGIGRAIASAFVEHDARVHICDIDERALATCALALPAVTRTVADVSRLTDVERLFAELRQTLGGLDVLVNNAGIAGPTGKIEDVAPEDWERTIAVDLTGMFYCTRLAMPMIKAAGGGSIVNLSSSAGRLGYPMRTAYAAAKWGVVGFTKSLAAEAGADGVRVNCIQPGLVAGERMDRVIAAKASARGVPFEAQRDELLDTVSMRVFVTAEDVANVVLFLASDAGRHISGQSIPVCGDIRYLS